MCLRLVKIAWSLVVYATMHFSGLGRQSDAAFFIGPIAFAQKQLFGTQCAKADGLRTRLDRWDTYLK